MNEWRRNLPTIHWCILKDFFLEYTKHLSTLATAKPKHDKPSPPAALSNKIYYVLNNERTAAKTTRDNHRSTGVPGPPVGDTNRISNCKQASSLTSKKNQFQTHSITSTHQRLTTQTSNRPSAIVKTPTNKARVIIDRFLSDIDISISHLDSSNNDDESNTSFTTEKSQNVTFVIIDDRSTSTSSLCPTQTFANLRSIYRSSSSTCTTWQTTDSSNKIDEKFDTDCFIDKNTCDWSRCSSSRTRKTENNQIIRSIIKHYSSDSNSISFIL